VSDFLSELRGEVVDAHARRRRSGLARRLGRWLASDSPRALAAAATTAAAVATVVAVRAISVREAVSPRVVEVIRVGGNPTGAVFSNGSVWVGDFARKRVIRLGPTNRREQGSVAVGGQPVAMAAGESGPWVRTAIGDGGTVARVGSRTRARVGYGSTLAAGAATAWAADVEIGPEVVHRIDAATGRDTGVIDHRGIYALATGGDSLWAVTNNGTVLRLDGRTGAVRARWPALAQSAGTANPKLIADASGAWVMRVGQGADSRVIRLEGDRVVRSLPIGQTVRPLLAQVRDALWTVSENAARTRYTAVRLDARDGAVTARVELGIRNPTSLVAVGDELWVTASDGTVTVIGNE
jgi:hypothetical protein